MHEKDVVKVLGLNWNIKHYQLLLCSKLEAPTAILVTKCEILQHVSSIFDPLGLVTPVNITAKLLLQELWQDSVSWDSKWNKAYQLKWASIVADISVALHQSFPWQYIPKHLTGGASTPIYRPACLCWCQPKGIWSFNMGSIHHLWYQSLM